MRKGSREVICVLRKMDCRLYTLLVMDLILKVCPVFGSRDHLKIFIGLTVWISDLSAEQLWALFKLTHE